MDLLKNFKNDILRW